MYVYVHVHFSNCTHIQVYVHMYIDKYTLAHMLTHTNSQNIQSTCYTKEQWKKYTTL